MRRVMLTALALPLVLLGAIFQAGQVSPAPCVTDEDVAEGLRWAAQGDVTDIDPDQLGRLGLAKAADTAVVVADSVVCRAVITAHNAFFGGTTSSKVVTDSAVVIRFGTSFGLSLIAGPSYGRELDVYDSTYTYKATIERLD